VFLRRNLIMANGFCDNCPNCIYWGGCICTYPLGEWFCDYFLKEVDRDNEIIYGKENKPKMNTQGEYSPSILQYFNDYNWKWD
jgi:hypothetical protein